MRLVLVRNASWATAAVFYVFMLASFAPFFLIDDEFNAPFNWSFGHLTVPIYVIVIFVGWRYQRILQPALMGFGEDKSAVDYRTSQYYWIYSFYEKFPRTAYWVLLIALAALLTLFSAGWVSLANAVVPPQRECVLQGIVERKFLTGGSRNTLGVIEVKSGNQIVKIEVTDQQYSALTVGDVYSEKRIIGSLGFSYKWKY